MAIFYTDSASFEQLTVTVLTATTSSISYLTQSQLNVQDNLITVNTNSPQVRFGGFAVIDSGSSNLSGSLLFDSQNNQWIYVHQSAPAAAITSSVLIMGPQTFNNVGNETTITTNRLTKGSGADLGEHITNSNITDTGTVVSINSNTEVTGSLKITTSVTASAFTGSFTGSLSGIAASSSYPLSIAGTTLYYTGPGGPTISGESFTGSIFLGSGSGQSATNASQSVFIGLETAQTATSANNSNFIGYQAGKNATNASSSNFIGVQTGISSTNAFGSNFIGYQAGFAATNAADSTFIGQIAGATANAASQSVFVGSGAGNGATRAHDSTFFGKDAGRSAISGSWTIAIGNRAGYNTFGGNANSIGTNNIIIGNNISVPAGYRDALNIGGLIFGTGSYSTFAGTPSTSPTNGRVGINNSTPLYTLDVGGSGNYTNGLTVTGSLIVTANLTVNSTASFTKDVQFSGSVLHEAWDGTTPAYYKTYDDDGASRTLTETFGHISILANFSSNPTQTYTLPAAGNNQAVFTFINGATYDPTQDYLTIQTTGGQTIYSNGVSLGTSFNLYGQEQITVYSKGFSSYTGGPSTSWNSIGSNKGRFSGSFVGNGSQLTNVVASATPAGGNKDIQFNDNGATSGSSNFEFDKTTNKLIMTGSIDVTGSISGSVFVGSNVPIMVWKTGSQSTASFTTLFNDNDLKQSLLANKFYRTKMFAIFSSSNANPDYKYAVIYTGTTASRNAFYYRRRHVGMGAAAGTDSENTIFASGSIDSTSVAVTTAGMGYVELEIFISTTNAGTLQFQWAQNTTDPSNLSVIAGSYVETHLTN